MLIGIAFLHSAARNYEGNYALAIALDSQSTTEQETNYLLAIRRIPGNESAVLKYSDSLKNAGNTTAALELLEQSSFGSNHWLGWQRRAALLAERASMPGGSEGDAIRAAALYDKVLRVHPENRTALEHRAQLALRQKDWALAGLLADRIERVDFNNLSANYLRAMLAKELGQIEKSQRILTSLLTQKGRGSTLFKKQDLHHELRLFSKPGQP